MKKYFGFCFLLIIWNLASCERQPLTGATTPTPSPSISPTAETPTPSPSATGHGAVKEREPKNRFAEAESFFKIIAIAAALLGGYYKFFRGRIFHPRLEIRMSSSLLLVGGRYFFKVIANLTNTGASRIPFDLPSSELSISLVNSSPPSIVDRAEWVEVATLEMTDRHRWIEGGELTILNWLVELPPMALTAVRAELLVAGSKTSWYADSIAENDPVILSVKPPQEEESKHGNTERNRPGSIQRPKEGDADREDEGAD